MNRHALNALAGALAATTACAPSKPATVEGDIYVAMQSGDTKTGSGREILLLDASGPLLRNVKAICDSLHRATEAAIARQRVALRRSTEFTNMAERVSGPAHAAELLDSASKYLQFARSIEASYAPARDSGMIRLFKTILAAQRDSTSSNIGGHYRFAGVAPGHYVLFALWPIDSHVYRFWIPITVTARQALTQDLNAPTADTFCHNNAG